MKNLILAVLIGMTPILAMSQTSDSETELILKKAITGSLDVDSLSITQPFLLDTVNFVEISEYSPYSDSNIKSFRRPIEYLKSLDKYNNSFQYKIEYLYTDLSGDNDVIGINESIFVIDVITNTYIKTIEIAFGKNSNDIINIKEYKY
jgi:hypothetical protein